jgi:hypothetical protein
MIARREARGFNDPPGASFGRDIRCGHPIRSPSSGRA